MAALLGLSALLAGMLISATGVGGVLIIPALMFFGDLGTHEAMATALLSFFFVGLFSTGRYQAHGLIDWPTSAPVLLGSLLSAYPGARLAALFSPVVLDLTLAAVIIFSTLYSMRTDQGAAQAPRGERGGRRRLALLFSIGAFCGFLCGLTGTGGGIVSIPLMLIFGFPALICVATSQALQIVISVAGSAGNLANGFIDFSLAWWVTGLEVAGAAAGVRIARSLPAAGLKKIVTRFCLLIGLVIGLRALF
jgi:uncharacterized membrane protein YfcA